MKKKIKILFTNLVSLEHNYGAQGIAFPLMARLNEYFDAEYCFILPEEYYKDNLSFAQKYNFNIIASPRPLVLLSKCYPFIHILYALARILLRRKRAITKRENILYVTLIKKLKESDIVIDLSGIEFIGDVSFKRKYSNCINVISMQCLAERHNKFYLKYTKSYGPFLGKFYKSLIKRQLNRLPFIFVRGENNLEEIRKLNLKVPIYSFPDISIALEPETKDWAITYIDKLKLDSSKPIVGLSPSSVIAGMVNVNSAGLNHLELCKKIINFFQSRNQQVLLIPHSIVGGKDITSCDLALVKRIYSELDNKEGVFIIDDIELTYKQVRAIIGLLDFYITGRYHSVSSALSMGIPVISLSWHMKYKDIMSLFLDNFLVIDCRTTGVEKSLSLIKRYYHNREWFNKCEVLKRKKKVVNQIDKSIKILVKEIKKHI